MSDGRPVTLTEAADGFLRVYPVAGTPAVGLGVVVNADLNLEFTAVATPAEPLVDDATGDILVDDATGNVLYDG